VEPKSNLLLGVLRGVRTVADVATDIDSKVTTDGARKRGKGVGLAKKLAASLDGLLTGPDHTDNRAREHVLDQAGEERLALEVAVLENRNYS
jgi:hypothetical protein